MFDSENPSFQGLRKILGLKTTYVDRNNTNDKVFSESNEKNAQTKGKGKKKRQQMAIAAYLQDKEEGK